MPDDYEIEERKSLAEVPGLRVRLLSLAPGQSVPWHLHRNITDTFFCRRGPLRVLTRNPAAEHVLNAGDMLEVLADTPHFVEGVDSRGCSFMIVQGVGEYDYVELEP
jgi:quercetin dioxygenase-like cupin family protein